jgi:restriction endonuclease S subunit
VGELPDVARAIPIEGDDLVVGARGDRTECFLASGALIGAYISLDLYLIRPDHAAVDARYLRCFLNLPSTQARLATSRQGSDLALARLPKEALESVEFILPPFEMQAKIGRLAEAAEREQSLHARLAEKRTLLNQETINRAIRSASQKPMRRPIR